MDVVTFKFFCYQCCLTFRSFLFGNVLTFHSLSFRDILFPLGLLFNWSLEWERGSANFVKLGDVGASMGACFLCLRTACKRILVKLAFAID